MVELSPANLDLGLKIPLFKFPKYFLEAPGSSTRHLDAGRTSQVSVKCRHVMMLQQEVSTGGFKAA